MLIQFSVSNFLSFDKLETFSMLAGKARKYSQRIYNDKRLKLTKCEVIFGANASGKSNLVSAFHFMQNMVLNGFPRGFTNKYHRINKYGKLYPSTFEIKILCDKKIFVYGYSVILNTAQILTEYLYEESITGIKKYIYDRDTSHEVFNVGQYFKHHDAIVKMQNYGDDSSNDQETLFLSIICKNKGKMYSDFPELQILRDIFECFATKINVSFPDSILTGYPYFTDTNLEEISQLLCALGTGISELKIIEVSPEVIKNKIPSELYNKIISDLEKANVRMHNAGAGSEIPRIMVRSYKEFYTFEINSENKIIITTIEFSHEREGIYFDLNEESDGTARLLDLIEILFKISNDRIFIIDEIDRCLHPAMTVKIIELFLEMAQKRNTQLIITSHESRLLAADILRNDEICFVTKNNQGASIINPLEKYQLRADKNVYAAMFDGTLNTLPAFNNTKLKSIIT